MSPARLEGRRLLVVGAGTQPSDDADAPVGNGRAIAVLAAREGAAVVCADRDREAAERQDHVSREELARKVKEIKPRFAQAHILQAIQELEAKGVLAGG